jgi:hypothetical protein
MAQTSPAYPFTGFVLNICAVTKGHRDSGDLCLCVVIPLGEWEGAELCLYEPRLVLDLSAGDMVAFPSHLITHFNLHMKGTRFSIILQTDKDMERWTATRNEWLNHMAPNTI